MHTLGKNTPLKFIGQILYIWIAITEYVQSAFSGPPAFSGPDTCIFAIYYDLHNVLKAIYSNTGWLC